MPAPMSVASKLIILVALAVVFGATMIALSVKHGDGPVSRDDEWGSARNIDKTFSVESGGKLVVDADEGDITVTGSESNKVVVHVSIRASESIAKQYDVRIDQEGGIVSIRARSDRKIFHWFDGNSLDVRYDVQVPRKFNLKLETSGGDIVLDGIEGDVYGQTSGGDLHIDDVHGVMNISTSGGDVKARKSTGEMIFETSGGDIECSDLSGKTSVETSGGDISVESAAGAIHASTSGGDIRVEMKDNKGIDLSTSGGSVSLTLPRSASGEVDAETSGGEVSCDFQFSGKMREGSLHGKINGGGDAIRLESSGGDILIHSVD